MQNGDKIRVKMNSDDTDTVEATVIDASLFSPSMMVKVEGQAEPVLIDPDTAKTIE